MPRQKSTHVDSPRAVGERLRSARLAAGLSQRQLSFPGCSPAYISRIESGDRIPSLQLLRELGRRLDVTEDWLATGAEAGPADIGGVLLEAEAALRLGELDLAERLYADLLDQPGGDLARARAYEGLGRVEAGRGDAGAAIERLEHALELYGTPDVEHPDLVESLSRCYGRLGQLGRAVDALERSLDAARREEDVVRERRLVVLLAQTLVDAGNGSRVEALLGPALEADAGVTSDARARVYWSQSRLHAERGRTESAVRYARRALEGLRIAEDAGLAAQAHRLRAQVELDRGRPEDALRLLEAARPLVEIHATPLERARFRLEEARALAQLGRKDEARALADHSSTLVLEAGPAEAAAGYSALAEIHENLGDRKLALELLERGAVVLEAETPSPRLGTMYTRLAELYQADGRAEAAYESMKKALAFHQAGSTQAQPAR